LLGLSAQLQILLGFLFPLVIGGGQLLGLLFAQEILKKLGFLQASISGKASGLNGDLSIDRDVNNDLFHGAILYWLTGITG